jgi:hypothetical protein
MSDISRAQAQTMHEIGKELSPARHTTQHWDSCKACRRMLSTGRTTVEGKRV